MNNSSRYRPWGMRMKWIARVGLISAALGAAAAHCISEAVDAVNRVRTEGCGDRFAVAPPLKVRAALNDAAQRLADGDKLATATLKSGYRAKTSTSIHIRMPQSRNVAQMLAQHFCGTVTNANLQEIGVFQRDDENWIVLAEPFAPPSPEPADDISGRVVALINEARRQSRRCGARSFPAVEPLNLSAALQSAALAHARDMASGSHLSHEGSDGSLPADRVTRAGYSWIAVAENVAAGPSTAEEVVNGWLTSPGHCANLMSSRYTETGAAFAFEPASEKGTYWAQVFAAPM